MAESSSLAASQNSVRNRQSQIENAVQQFLFANSGMGKHKGELPATEIETKSSNQGGGSIANTSDLKGRVSVVVIDVLPNGVLVIEGARMVTFSGELLCGFKGHGATRRYWFWFQRWLAVSQHYFFPVYRGCSSRICFSKGSSNDAQKENFGIKDWHQF